MPTFRLRLWTSPKTDPAPVYLVLQHGRGQRATLATGVRVAERDWNEKKSEVRRSRPNAASFNKRLREVEAAAADVVDAAVASGGHVTAAGLRDEVAARLAPEFPSVEAPPPDFLAFMGAWVEEFAAKGQVSTHKAYRTVYRKLREHAGGSLAYGDLTAAYFKAWGQSLKAPPPHGPGHRQNYVGQLLKSTRTAIRAALLRDEAPEGFQDPFERLRGDAILGTERVKKASLSISQVRALAGAEAQPGSVVEAVRDAFAFAFAFFAGGLRFGDVCLLRWDNVGTDDHGRLGVSFQAEKTGKLTETPVPGEAADILARHRAGRGPRAFVFPFLDRRDVSTPARRRAAIGSVNAYANGKLKVLARRAGVENPDRVTFHVARHSLAAYLHDSGVSHVAIKERLQHSSVTTTEQYLRGIDRGRLDDEYLGAFS